jgi:hypothetical protein
MVLTDSVAQRFYLLRRWGMGSAQRGVCQVPQQLQLRAPRRHTVEMLWGDDSDAGSGMLGDSVQGESHVLSMETTGRCLGLISATIRGAGW